MSSSVRLRQHCGSDFKFLTGPLNSNLPHYAITELAEGRATDRVIRSIAGQLSKEMLEHYSHIRLDAKCAALESLSRSGSSVVTSQRTSQTRGQSHLPIRK